MQKPLPDTLCSMARSRRTCRSTIASIEIKASHVVPVTAGGDKDEWYDSRKPRISHHHAATRICAGSSSSATTDCRYHQQPAAGRRSLLRNTRLDHGNLRLVLHAFRGHLPG